MTVTTATSAFGFRPDLTFMAREFIPDALILQCTTVAANVEGDEVALRAPYVDEDTAEFVPEGTAIDFAAPSEGTAIDFAAPSLDECVIYTGKLAQLIGLSNEFTAQQGSALLVEDSMKRAIVSASDAAFLAQVAPTPPAVAPPAGLLNVTGVEAGGEVSGSLDVLVDLLAALESNGARPSHIIVDPLGFAELRKMKTATGSNVSLIGAGVEDAALRLFSLPVIVNRHMTAYSGLVLDKGSVISAVGPVKLDKSPHALFSSDSVAIRVTFRSGWNVVRPNRLGTFTVAVPTP